MAELQIEDAELVLHLSSVEKMEGLHGDVRVPLSSVTGARSVDDLWQELRGMRAPGTGVPGTLAVGTWRGGFGKDFAVVARPRPGRGRGGRRRGVRAAAGQHGGRGRDRDPPHDGGDGALAGQGRGGGVPRNPATIARMFQRSIPMYVAPGDPGGPSVSPYRFA
jgi:hypothetical protein